MTRRPATRSTRLRSPPTERRSTGASVGSGPLLLAPWGPGDTGSDSAAPTGAGHPGQHPGSRGRSRAAVLGSPGRHRGAAGGLPRASGAELSLSRRCRLAPPRAPPIPGRHPLSPLRLPAACLSLGEPQQRDAPGPAAVLPCPAGGLRPLVPSLTRGPGRASPSRGRRLAPRKRSWGGCCAFPRRRPASSPPLPSKVPAPHGAASPH